MQFPPAIHFVTRQSHQEKQMVRIEWRKVLGYKVCKDIKLPTKQDFKQHNTQSGREAAGEVGT